MPLLLHGQLLVGPQHAGQRATIELDLKSHLISRHLFRHSHGGLAKCASCESRGRLIELAAIRAKQGDLGLWTVPNRSAAQLTTKINGSDEQTFAGV